MQARLGPNELHFHSRVEDNHGTGQYALIRKGDWHTLANPGPEPARFLVILSPPGFEGYWAERAERMAQKGGALDPEEVAALQAKYRMDAGDAVRRFE